MIDLVIEGMGPTYRILDLDELAAAVVDRRVAPAVAASALRSAQAFVESFLHRGAAFPPAEVRPWFSTDHRYPPLPLAEDHSGKRRRG
jgi:predicted RNA-binding protein associated with RNAse of E/G family